MTGKPLRPAVSCLEQECALPVRRNRRIGKVAPLEHGELELVVQHVVILAGALEIAEKVAALSEGAAG